MTKNTQSILNNRHEHSVPLFWPLTMAIELGEVGLKKFQSNMRLIEVAEQISIPSEWATANRIELDLDTLLLRDFSPEGGALSAQLPVLIDAPYAGHSSTIADFAVNQSLVQTLQSNGLQRVLVMDWKSASKAMKNFDIDKYLAEINVVVDQLGGKVNLVGLCQGGWMSAMYAARFPKKVNSLVLAGAPIDTHAGNGPLKKIVSELPYDFYQNLVNQGDGLMLGHVMLAGWKDMNPEQQYFGKYLDLYQHIEDENYIERTENFERWYENPIDLPGVYYLQAIKSLFMENAFAKGEYVALGEVLSLKNITCPVYLLAGESDDITPKEQVFAAQNLLGTPQTQIIKAIAPGGHIGLFMGTKTITKYWPKIATWIAGVNQKSDHI